jgi:E3 ubiquitin-protein ligase TRIP12
LAGVGLIVAYGVKFYGLFLQELDLYDILSFDTDFGKILQELQILVHRKKYLESSGDSTQAIASLHFRGSPIEDLCLDFTLPGYPDYVLKEGEESTTVSVTLPYPLSNCT